MIPVAAELIDWLANMLVQAVWIATAVALPAWAVLRRTRDPRTSHHVALVALLLIAMGLVTVGINRWPAAPTAMVTAEPRAHSKSPIVQAPTAPTSAVMVTISEQTRWNWRGCLAGAWCVGVFAMSLRHAVGWWTAVRLRRTATIIEGELAQRFRALCRATGMDAPLLLASARIAVPAAIGWWRQAVVIPVGLLTGLPAAQVDALILHELAHLRRYDWVVEMLVSLLECALFFHPAVWWLGRCLRQAREQCCDVQALRAGANPEGLTKALCALAERTAPDSPVLAATGGMLANRVRRILGIPERRERPWRALAAIALLPLLLIVVTACATAASAHRVAAKPLALDPLLPSDPERNLPLARRIRAHADGRQIHSEIRMIEAPITFWKNLGLDADHQMHLDRAGVQRVLAAAAATHIDVKRLFDITAFPLQKSDVNFMNQYASIGDYQLVDGQIPDPVISILCYGSLFQIRAEAVSKSNSVVLADAHYSGRQLLGVEEATFQWSADGADKTFPVEMPVVLIEEGRVDPDTRLGPEEAVAIPLSCRVQRAVPTFRQAREHATIVTHIADPDLQTRPRQVCLIFANVVEIENDHDPAHPRSNCLMDVSPAAAWLDTARVTLDLHHAPLETAITRLAAQLPVPVEVVRDDDFTATQVDLIAHDEPARAVIDRLLAQSLLCGKADLVRLRLTSDPHTDILPLDTHGESATSPNRIPPATAKGFDTLPGPAWEPPLLRRYDLRDLMRPPVTFSEAGWTIAMKYHFFENTSDAEAALRQAVFPATWIAERTVKGDADGGVEINAAPAVHRAIEAELTRIRGPRNQVYLHLDLVRLDAKTWTALGLSDVASTITALPSLVSHPVDSDLYRRIRVAAHDAGDQPTEIDATVFDGEHTEVQPDPVSWWSGMFFSVHAILSADRKNITLSFVSRWPHDQRGGTVTERSSSTMIPDGSRFLLTGPNDGTALLIEADTVIFEEIR